MAQKFVTPITIKNLASSGSDALTVFLNGEVYGRVKLEAGGRISWGNGEGGYDTNIYRDSANVLATDDVLKATAGIITMAVAGAPTAALADGALAVDTTNNTFYFRANGAWSEISGNSTITVSDTAPADAEVGSLWFDSTSLEMFIYYGSAWVQLNADTGAEELSDLFDIEFTNLTTNQILKYDGEKWINGNGSSTTVSGSAPASASSGDLWYDSTTLGLFIYYSGNWIELNADTGAEELSDLTDINITTPTNGQVLKYNGTEWVNAADNAGTTISSIDDINDVTITSAANGQILQYNGTVWVNAAIAAGATVNVSETAPASPSSGDLWFESDTAKTFIYYDSQWIEVGAQAPNGASALTTKGDLLSRDASTFARLAVGTNGYFLKADSSTSTGLVWAAIPTINNLDDIGDVTITSVSSGQVLKWNGTAWANAADNAGTTISSIDDITDVTISSVQNGDLLKWNGTAWVNAAGYALLASPTFTGTVTVPTPTNNTDASTKAYVDAAQSAAQVYADNLTVSLSDITDGITADASEINILNGATVSAAELNILDGATLSVTELNYVDGVTSAIQTQIDSKAPLASPTFTGTVSGITKTMVGLGSVDNTTDANKPVSTATQTALDLKSNLASPTFTGTLTANDVTVSGNLTVSGTTTSINTETLTVNDNIVVLNNNVTSSPTENAGIEVERGTSTNVLIRWNETTDKWQFTNDGSTYTDLGIGSASISSTAPTSPVSGQIWFYQDTAQTFIYYGTNWIEVGAVSNGARVEVSSTAPASPATGDLWFDSDTAQTFTYYDSQWIEIGASGMAASVGDSAPTSPVNGQIWFDSANASTNVYYDSQWVEVGGGAGGSTVSISDSAPSSPTAGTLWFNSTSGATFIYYGSVWVEVGVAPFDQLLSTLDAKGDLLVGTADNTVTKLAVGSANQVLTVDSTTATGLKWATPTAYQAVVANVSDTEIGYLDGVTSAIQTQLDTIVDYYITNSGSGAYLVNGVSNGVIHFKKGKKYKVRINATGHPFWIQTVSGAYSSGNVYSTGITNGGTQSGMILVELPQNAPDTLYYACQYHSSMAGSISTLSIEPDVKTELNTKASTGKSIAMAIVFGG